MKTYSKALLAVLALAALSLAAQAGSTITVKGSDTMVILAQKWAETYMIHHFGRGIDPDLIRHRGA